MERTIMVKNKGDVYYHGKLVEYMYSDIRDHFKLEDSKTHKYVITIVESETGRYWFEDDSSNRYLLRDGKHHMKELCGCHGICKSHFKRIFFKPKVGKRYNITVKKVVIKSKQ